MWNDLFITGDLSWVRIQNGDEYGLRHKCGLKWQLWEVWISPFISGRIFSSFIFPDRNEEWGTSVLSSLPQLAVCLQHLNFLYRIHLKERRGELVGESKFTCPQRFSDLSKRPQKVDLSGVVWCFWEIQLAQWFKRRVLQKLVSDILKGGVFFISIFYGEMSPVLQGPLSCRIFTGKKNIHLQDTLYMLCYWWCYPFPIYSPLPAMLLFSLSPSSSCTSYSSPSFLFPLSPPTADICTSTVFALQKHRSFVPFCIFLFI